MRRPNASSEHHGHHSRSTSIRQPHAVPLARNSARGIISAAAPRLRVRVGDALPEVPDALSVALG